METRDLMLDYVYRHEVALGEEVFLSQPVGGGVVVDYTWRQTMEQARRMAAHLQARRLGPGAKIAILSKNCAHFIMAELAIWMAGYTTVAIFPTETASTVRYVLEHSEARLLFVGKLDTLDQQRGGFIEGLPIIAFPLAPENTYESWDSITANTPPISGTPLRQGGDIAMLMYTSGSTGQPKGVMHSFERITAAAVGINTDTNNRIGANTRNRMLSYLPLAHVFERAWVEAASLINGNTHLYFAESLDTFIQDLHRARPVTFVSVPRLWLKFQQGVFAKMPAKKLERLLSIPLIGRLIGRKVLKGLGLDQTLLAGSGSAPIPGELILWYRRLGLNLIEGYAMTEDFAYSHNSTAAINAPGCVGVPLAGVQVRISDDGEVLIKSPGQFVGYYKRPDLDAEAFTEDGFFRTGDKGERRSDGLLKLTGRVKELFKTAKGKYVAPAPIESRINASPRIETSMVSGVGRPSAYALVVLAETVRPLLNDPVIKAEVQADLEKLLVEVNAELADYERLQMLVVSPEPWTVENGMLTPTLKIKRSQIEAAVEKQLDDWYSKSPTVQWA
jgi:long-chain acyl-CoA synthetase